MNTLNSGRVNPFPSSMYRSYKRIPQSEPIHIIPSGHIETDPSTSSYSRISEGPMFDLDSSSVARSLIGLFLFRCKPVTDRAVSSLLLAFPLSNVYQHRSRHGGISEVA